MTTHNESVVGDPTRKGIRGAVLAGFVLLVVAALVFATSYATEETANDGQVAVRSEALLGANDVAFKAVAQAVLLAEDRSFGVADDAAVELAVGEGVRRLEAIRAATVNLGALGEDNNIADLASRVRDLGREVLLHASEGDPEVASDLLAGEMKVAFEALRDEASALRNTAETELASTGDFASLVATVARFIVAFLLPLALVLAYRISARRQLRIAEAQLDTRLAAERKVLQAKDEFIANISHELRTPLTSIYGFSEILLDMGIVDPDSTMDLIGLINAESAELGRMVEDLIVSARAEAGQLTLASGPVDLASEVASVVAPMSRYGKDIDVRLDATQLTADPLRIRQIVRNLLSNAVRYGGPRIEIVSHAEDDTIVLSVCDNGPGIEPAIEPRLFTRYVHGGEEALTIGSVGLGLAVVKSLAHGMHGEVSYSHVDGWTWFTVRLPAEPPPSGGASTGVEGHQLGGDTPMLDRVDRGAAP